MALVSEEEGRKFADPNDFTAQVREYVRVKNTIDMMDARAKELRQKLFEVLDNQGEEDLKGNIVFALPAAVDGVVSLEKQRRVTRKLNEALAETLIEEKGIGDRVYEVKRVINEEALMAAYYDELLTEEELDSMFPANVVWALRTVKK